MVQAGVLRKVAMDGIHALEHQRAQRHSQPEHAVRMGAVLRGDHAPAHGQAEQVDGIEAREAGLPKAVAVKLAVARAAGVVVGQHKAREQDEEAHRGKAGIDHRGQHAEPLGIGEMKEDDVDGRKGAQARQCIQPFWLAHLHKLLDALGK